MDLLKSLFGGSSSSVSLMTAIEASAALNSSQPPFFLDVRQPEEFAAGHIAGAKLIPLGELSRRMDELPAGQDIVCVCQSGSRSGMAARQLAHAGHRVINLRGGMIGWQMAGLPVKRGR